MIDYFPIFIGFVVALFATYVPFFGEVDRYEKATRDGVLADVSKSQGVNEHTFREWFKKWHKASQPSRSLDRLLWSGVAGIASSLVGWICQTAGISLEPFVSWALVVCGGIFATHLIAILWWHRNSRRLTKKVSN